MTEVAGPTPAIDADVRGTVLLAGAGKMGGSLLGGWLECGLDPTRVVVIDPHAPASTLQDFAGRGIRINPTPGEVEAAGTLVLAVKPQMLASAAPALNGFVGAETLVVSIVAGKTVADLTRTFPNAVAWVRAMPNTPAAVGRGITGVWPGASLAEAHRREITALLGAVGHVEWLGSEAQVDAVTAVSGSGPAYVFYVTECLAAAAEHLGFAPDVAARLARATVEGAAALLTSQPGTPPSTLRENVTSPGGTTAAALQVLMQDDRLCRVMSEAVAAAHRRAGELAG